MRRACSIIVGVAALLLVLAPAGAAVQKQEIIKEIQAAFTAWSEIPCSGLKFNYAGELPSYASEKPGALLVYFGYDRNTWGHADNAFFTQDFVDNETSGEISKGIIALNAYKFDWSIGKSPNHIDIRTAVTKLIPLAIGFYVGPDPKGSLLTGLIQYNLVDHALLPLHQVGAQFIYFAAGTSCTQPDGPPICGKASWTADGGVPVVDLGPPREAGPAADQNMVADQSMADLPGAPGDLGPKPDAATIMHLCIHHTYPNEPAKGKPYHWAKIPIDYYVYIPEQGRIPGGVPVIELDGPARDLGPATPDQGTGGNGGGDDDGCCRVSHAGAGAVPGGLLLLALFAGLLLLGRRRG